MLKGGLVLIWELEVYLVLTLIEMLQNWIIEDSQKAFDNSQKYP